MYRYEKNGDIVIDGWESGISDSPYGTTLQTQVGNIQRTGMSDMRNVNIISIPGEASVGWKTTAAQQTPITAAAYTATATTDTFAYTGTVLKNGTAIVITVSAGTAGITTGNTYWVKNATATTFTVGSGVDGGGAVSANIDITSNGTGTFTTVDLGAIQQIVPYDTSAYYLGSPMEQSYPSTTDQMFAVDNNGRAWIFISTIPNWVYLGNSTITSAPPKPNGIAFWKNYILIFRAGDAAIDYRQYSPTSSLTAWTYGWSNATSTTSARTFIDTSGVLYWGNGSQVAQLIELTTFDPTSAPTFTLTASALKIRYNDFVNCIDQLGGNLIVGAQSNILYSWNRDPLNAGNFSAANPILLPEATIAKIVVVNSNAYLFAGNRGRIYITNGANVQLYQKIPDHLSGTIEPYYAWGGAVYSRNQLYFSVSAMNSATLAAIPNYGGIWAISTDTNALRLVNRLSYGTYAGIATELAQTFHAQSAPNTAFGIVYSQVSLICGWYDGITGYGADFVSTNPTPYSNYEAYIDSDMIPVGTFLNSDTDANVEYKLTVPMVAGEGVKLAYRQDFSQSFTDITNISRPTGEFTSADVGSGISGVVQVNFQKSQWLQIRCYLKSTATNPSYTRLREIRVR